MGSTKLACFPGVGVMRRAQKGDVTVPGVCRGRTLTEGPPLRGVGPLGSRFVR